MTFLIHCTFEWGEQICAAKGFLHQKQTSYRAPNLDLHSHYWWLHSLRISCNFAARLWRFRLFQITSSIPSKGFLRQKQISYRAPNLDLHSHYWWLHSFRISCDSAARLWRNAIKTFHHTVVCVTTVTMPVRLHGTNFTPFLLRTGRCYDAETSTILLLVKRAFA